MKINVYKVLVGDDVPQKDFILNHNQWRVGNFDKISTELIRSNVYCNYTNKKQLMFNLKIDDPNFFETNKKLFVEIIDKNSYILGMNQFLGFIIEYRIVSGDNMYVQVNLELDILSSVINYKKELLDLTINIDRTTIDDFLYKSIHLLKEEEYKAVNYVYNNIDIVWPSYEPEFQNIKYFININSRRTNSNIPEIYYQPSTNQNKIGVTNKYMRYIGVGFKSFSNQWQSSDGKYINRSFNINKVISEANIIKEGVWLLPYCFTSFSKPINTIIDTIQIDKNDVDELYHDFEMYQIKGIKNGYGDILLYWKDVDVYNNCMFPINGYNYLDMTFVNYESLDVNKMIGLHITKDKEYYLLTNDWHRIPVYKQDLYIKGVGSSNSAYVSNVEITIKNIDYSKSEPIFFNGYDYSESTDIDYVNRTDNQNYNTMFRLASNYSFLVEDDVDVSKLKRMEYGVLLKPYDNWYNEWPFWNLKIKPNYNNYNNNIFDNNIDINYINGITEYIYTLSSKGFTLDGIHINYNKNIDWTYITISQIITLEIQDIISFRYHTKNGIISTSKKIETSVPIIQNELSSYMYNNYNSYKIQEELNQMKKDWAYKEWQYGIAQNSFNIVESGARRVGSFFQNIFDFINPFSPGFLNGASAISGMVGDTAGLGSDITDTAYNFEKNNYQYEVAKKEYDLFYANLKDKDKNVLQSSGTYTQEYINNFNSGKYNVIEKKPVENEYNYLCYFFKKYGKGCYPNTTSLKELIEMLDNGKNGKVNYIVGTLLNDTNNLLANCLQYELSQGVWIYV